MQSILVLIGGGDRDDVIMRTAHAAAIPLGSHLEFLHVRVSVSTAMRHDEHAQFAIGPSIKNALEEFDTRASAFSQLASDHVLDFVKLLDEQRAGGAPITATYREVYDARIEHLVEEAGKHDLVVIGRARQKQGLAQDTLERLIRECERPLLIPTKETPNSLTGAIMVCWNGSDNVCKTVRACEPLLARAQRLVFVSIGGLDAAAVRERDQLSSLFAKQGVSAELRNLPSDGRVPEALARAASELDATLIVMGAYGRWRLRQLILGSCTEDSLRCIERPILLMH
ncbi:MAG TPA: universal stress protein [Micropepsaceae bacterium]|nr:universal stress protein [Micropepsaceae bacterium]